MQIDDEATETVADAIETVVENSERRAEVAEDVAEMAIENAQARVDAAHETAQQITDAALATSLGTEIGVVRTEVLSCAERVSSLETTVAEQQSRLTEMSETLAQMREAMAHPQMVQLLSTPQTSEAPTQTPPATAIAEPVLPAAVDENPVAADVLPARKKRTWT